MTGYPEEQLIVARRISNPDQGGDATGAAMKASPYAFAHTDNFVGRFEARDACPARARWERGVEDNTSPVLSGGVVDGKVILKALNECCVETSKLVSRHEPFGGLNAEDELRQSQDELRQLSVQLLTIQENERRRIAADLHDGIGQSMTLIKMSMESVAQLINAGAHQEAVESLRQMIHKVNDTMTELRTITTDLRPAMLDDLGLVPTLTWFFREFESAWRDQKVEKDFSIAEYEIPVPLKTTIFRIVQEAMNNIAKHANARRIRVSLKKTNGLLQLSIEDNGRGFDMAGLFFRHGPVRGHGLLTMKERARSSDGIFEMRSTPGHGTQLLISWGLPETAAERGANPFATMSMRNHAFSERASTSGFA